MSLKVAITSIALISLSCMAPYALSKDRGGGKHLVLNLVGSGPMYQGTVPDIEGGDDDFEPDDAICFDTDLYDAKNRRFVGRATDCLSNIMPSGLGVKLVGTTFFHMPQGTLVTRGNTSVQPVGWETVTPAGQVVTHVTGASGTGNAVLEGTGRFAGASGTVRLSGMVDMTNFGGEVGDPIAFDCLFVINLD